jgi:predicted RNase H-like HicB family nuclease
VLIESCEEGGFFATCPSLPGCHVQGEKLENTLNEMKAVIDAYLKDLKAHHESISKPTQFTITSIGVAV